MTPEKPRSQVIHDLFRSLDLPASAAGQLDWVTGIYRVNRTLTEWHDYFAHPENDVDLTITLIHEMHHFLQVSAFSYLHRFASLLYYSIAEVATQSYNDMSTLPDDLKQSKAIRDAVWDLQWKDPNGLSVLDIVESLTHFVEVNTDRPYTTSAYLDLLKSSPGLPDEYSRAFLHFYEATGRNGAAAAIFEVVCHMALCSMRPRPCLDMLAACLRSGEVTLNMTFDDIREFCRERDEHHSGFTWDWRHRVGDQLPRHPIFGSLDAAVNDPTVANNFVKYVLSPHRFFEPFMKLAQAPPILFNPTPDIAAAGFEEWPADVGLALRKAPPEEKRKRLTWLLYMAAASRKYLGRIGVPPTTVRPVG